MLNELVKKPLFSKAVNGGLKHRPTGNIDIHECFQ